MAKKQVKPLTEGSTKGGTKKPSGKPRPSGKPPSQKPPLGDDIERQLEESKKDREKLMTIICNAMSAIACADHERSMVMLPKFLEDDLRKFIGDVKAQASRLQEALEKARKMIDELAYEPAGTGVLCCQECAMPEGEPHDEACPICEDLIQIDKMLAGGDPEKEVPPPPPVISGPPLAPDIVTEGGKP